MTERIHPIESTEGKTPAQMAKEVSRLRYDAILVFLDHLAKELEEDSIKDAGRGRNKLAEALNGASGSIDQIRAHIALAWDISKPYMKDELDARPEVK